MGHLILINTRSCPLSTITTVIKPEELLISHGTHLKVPLLEFNIISALHPQSVSEGQFQSDLLEQLQLESYVFAISMFCCTLPSLLILHSLVIPTCCCFPIFLIMTQMTRTECNI